MPCQGVEWDDPAVSEPPEPKPYEHPSGHHMVHSYQVDGETFAELWFGAAIWGQVQIDGGHHDQVGEGRVTDARFFISLPSPPAAVEGDWWDFDLDDVQRQLARA